MRSAECGIETRTGMARGLRFSRFRNPQSAIRICPEEDAEAAALADGALRGDGAAHGLDQVAHDRQAEAEAAGAARARRVGAVEAVEDAVEVLGGDADAGGGDGDGE